MDGKDASDFLGVNAKAADSDKLDGKDSVAYTNPVVSAQTDDTELPFLTVVELAELTITTPSGGGIAIWGMLRPEKAVNGQATWWLQVDNGTCTFDVANFFSITPSRIGNEGTFDTASPIMGVAEVAAGDHTVTVCGRTFDGSTLTVETTLMAMYATDVTKSGSISSAGDLGEEGVPTS